MEIYHGPSLIDGGQIFAVTTETSNKKTGQQVQIWILNAEMLPLTAVGEKKDRSVCGDCKHRGSTCYVVLHMAPHQIFRSWVNGKYEPAENTDFLTRRNVRFGAYGDPAALPFELVNEIVGKTSGHTGYSHQWKLDYVQPYKKYLMASVDSLDEYYQAKELGWRTFRVKNPDDKKLKNEIVCPASIEAGQKSTCEKCGLCSGTEGKGKKDVVINVHGLPFKQERFKRMSLQMAA